MLTVFIFEIEIYSTSRKGNKNVTEEIGSE